ncbi:MAG TPA: TA system VapC family ribonuclease toxin [Usitatibacter sp.]|nr:TA system VapC family ribonuclease toxin [Usitatibacter sp.]
MRSLLDVNVLVAMLDSEHSLHTAAWAWFEDNAKSGWASCPITQNGCIRVMSQPTYLSPVPVDAITRRLREATSHAQHQFWPDDVSLLDKAVIDTTRIHGPKQLTDAYLLSLAVSKGGRLVTFDQSLPVTAVLGAQKKHLLVL